MWRHYALRGESSIFRWAQFFNKPLSLRRRCLTGKELLLVLFVVLSVVVVVVVTFFFLFFFSMFFASLPPPRVRLQRRLNGLRMPPKCCNFRIGTWYWKRPEILAMPKRKKINEVLAQSFCLSYFVSMEVLQKWQWLARFITHPSLTLIISALDQEALWAVFLRSSVAEWFRALVRLSSKLSPWY